jgi:hypothetical protein
MGMDQEMRLYNVLRPVFEWWVISVGKKTTV